MSLPTPYYDADGIVIFHADCRDVLPHIDPASVDLLLTDPPYGQALDTDFSTVTNPGRTYQRVVGDDEPFDPRTLLQFGRVALFGANYFSDLLPVGQWAMWRKVNAGPIFAAGELVWHNCGGRPVDFYESTVNAARDRDGALHPTQKPVSLMHWLLARFNVRPGQLILDPYMGSGPLARACFESGVRYIGVEIEERYCQIAVKRLAQGVLPLEVTG